MKRYGKIFPYPKNASPKLNAPQNISGRKKIKTELWRKALHLSSLWMPALILSVNPASSTLLFGTLLIISITAEYLAFQRRFVIGIWFRRLFIKILRPKELNRKVFVPSGAIYILAAAFIVSACYTPKAAAAGMSLMLIADSAAALFGRYWGTHRFANGKSLQGTAAFMLCGLWVTFLFFPTTALSILLGTVLLAALAEFFEKELKIDDNLLIPLASGFILNLI